MRSFCTLNMNEDLPVLFLKAGLGNLQPMGQIHWIRPTDVGLCWQGASVTGTHPMLQHRPAAGALLMPKWGQKPPACL